MHIQARRACYTGQVDTSLKLSSTFLEGLVSFPNPLWFHSSLKDPSITSYSCWKLLASVCLGQGRLFISSQQCLSLVMLLPFVGYLLFVWDGAKYLYIFLFNPLNKSTKEVLISQFTEKNTRAQRRCRSLDMLELKFKPKFVLPK